MREANPWFRKFDGWWYVEIAGRQKKLAKGRENRAEAVRQFYLLMAGTQPVAPSTLTAAEICDLFLRHSEKEHEPDTFAWHKHYLQSFCDRCGHQKASDADEVSVGENELAVAGASGAGRELNVRPVERRAHLPPLRGRRPCRRGARRTPAGRRGRRAGRPGK